MVLCASHVAKYTLANTLDKGRLTAHLHVSLTLLFTDIKLGECAKCANNGNKLTMEMSPALLKPILDCICPHSKTWCTWCRRTAVFLAFSFIASLF